MENGYSLSDIAAASGDGFGGTNAWVLIILFALIFGINGNGFGNNRYMDSAVNTYASAASQQEILSGQKFDTLSRQINSIGDGLSSLGYSQLQQMDANTAAINGNVVGEGRAIQTQLANCCCENKEAIAQVRYDMSNFAASINQNIESKFAALEKNQLEQRLAEQAAQIQQLQLNSALCGVVRYPNATTYCSGSNPFGCGCGYGNGNI